MTGTGSSPSTSKTSTSSSARAPIRSKGGDTEFVYWDTGTAHLLPRLLRRKQPRHTARKPPVASPAGSSSSPDPGAALPVPEMRAAPNPRALTGRSGASSHVLRVSPRAFLRFPGCPPGSSPSSAFLWFPFVRRSPVRSLRPLPSSGSPSVSLRVPFPLDNLHVSAAAGRFRRRRSRAAGTKVTSSAATTSPGSRDPPALQLGSGRARWDAAAESPVCGRSQGDCGLRGLTAGSRPCRSPGSLPCSDARRRSGRA